MMQRMGTRTATVVAQAAEVRSLRRQAREIGEDVLDMMRTLVRMGDASDWADTRIPALDGQIRRFEEIREALLDRAMRIELGLAA
jgi:hypothetical protein